MHYIHIYLCITCPIPYTLHIYIVLYTYKLYNYCTIHIYRKVIVVNDDLAKIFKSSPRAKSLFPDLSLGGAAAICLARYVQEPLAEYCNLWTLADANELFGFESYFLNLHPLKVCRNIFVHLTVHLLFFSSRTFWRGRRGNSSKVWNTN